MLLKLMFIVGLTLMLGCSSGEKLDLTRSEDPAAIRSSLAKYAEVPLSVKDFGLSDRRIEVLKDLVKAAASIDDIYWKQSYTKSLRIRSALQESGREIDGDYLRFLEINYGPFDRLKNDLPFIGVLEKPKGAGFYPEDMTRDMFEQFLRDNPAAVEEFSKFNTLIRRGNNELTAVPFETEYQIELGRTASHLQSAALTTPDTLFHNFLDLRAKALQSGEYFDSDMAWMNLDDNLIDIVIGPIDASEDRLMGIKRAYQAIVLVRDPEATEQLGSFLKSIDQLEARLPVPRLYRKPFVPRESPIEIFNTVYLSGAANAGTKSIALSLPIDERVRELEGLRNIQQKNIILAKFNKILVPIAGEVLMEELIPYLDGDAFFTHKVLHELSHSLGIKYVKHENGITVRNALKETYSTIEEAKADALGLYNVGYYIQRGVLRRDFEQRAYVTFLASMFRSARFGLASAHARATLLVFNYLRKENAVIFDPSSRRYGINARLMRNAIKKLAAELLMIEGDGNYEAAKLILKEMSFIPDDVALTINRLSEIPEDVTFTFDPLLF